MCIYKQIEERRRGNQSLLSFKTLNTNFGKKKKKRSLDIDPSDSETVFVIDTNDGYFITVLRIDVKRFSFLKNPS